jgi:hypothetical protein
VRSASADKLSPSPAPQIPEYFEFTHQLAQTASGKVSKIEMQKKAVSLLNDRAATRQAATGIQSAIVHTLLGLNPQKRTVKLQVYFAHRRSQRSMTIRLLSHCLPLYLKKEKSPY